MVPRGGREGAFSQERHQKLYSVHHITAGSTWGQYVSLLGLLTVVTR